MYSTPRLDVALALMRPVVGEPDTNLAALESALGEYEHVDLMIWPKLFLCGYTTSRAGAPAETLDGERVDRLRAAAKRHGTARHGDRHRPDRAMQRRPYCQ